jgi:hypothetical protein
VSGSWLIENSQRVKQLLKAEIERLRAQLDDAAKEVVAHQEENERLRSLIKDLADDLENEIRDRYRGMLEYPSMLRRFERDMGNVYEAHRVLEGDEPDGDDYAQRAEWKAHRE